MRPTLMCGDCRLPTAKAIQWAVLSNSDVRGQHVRQITLTQVNTGRVLKLRPVGSRAQYTVLVNELKVSKVFCVIGFSMGGQQVSAARPRAIDTPKN